ncbi:MAG: MBOAT family O-acyltransferase, partial [Winogradskyella sp.]
SDIAIGVSRLFGFDLMKNFAFPYFSRDIAEFWRRWHISLSTWFRDYLYIPLGGSKGSTIKKIRNVFIIFLVSGFWHGSNWTFVVWGGLNALYFLPIMLRDKNRKHMEVVASNTFLPTIKESIQMFSTFLLTVFAWIFFRSDNIKSAIDYISILCSKSFMSMPIIKSKSILALLLFFMAIEWLGRKNDFALEQMTLKQPLRWLFYVLLIMLIAIFEGKMQEFIYFQF